MAMLSKIKEESMDLVLSLKSSQLSKLVNHFDDYVNIINHDSQIGQEIEFIAI